MLIVIFHVVYKCFIKNWLQFDVKWLWKLREGFKKGGFFPSRVLTPPLKMEKVIFSSLTWFSQICKEHFEAFLTMKWLNKNTKQKFMCKIAIFNLGWQNVLIKVQVLVTATKIYGCELQILFTPTNIMKKYFLLIFEMN